MFAIHFREYVYSFKVGRPIKAILRATGALLREMFLFIRFLLRQQTILE